MFTKQADRFIATRSPLSVSVRVAFRVLLVGESETSAEPPRLVETPVYGAQLENLSEHRAADVEQAATYLDSALNAYRTGM